MSDFISSELEIFKQFKIFF